MEFFRENVIYIGLAIGSGLALLWPMLGRSASGANNINSAEAVLLMNRNKPLILDVRDDNEFAEGHIQGAKNIPVTKLLERIKEIEKFKEKPVLVYCQGGPRSKAACSILRGQAYTQLHHLEGGLQAWHEAKMPVIKT